MTHIDQLARSASKRPWLVDPARITGSIVWLSGGICALIVGSGGSETDVRRAGLLLSLLALALGLRIFWAHGGRMISAVGIWGVAFALFVGFAGTYTLGSSQGSPPGMLGALSAAYFGQVFMWGFFWSYPSQEEARRDWIVDTGVVRWGMTIGATLLLLSSLLSGRLGEEANTLVDAAAFVSAILVSTPLLLPRKGATATWRYLLPAAAFAAYASFIFAGFGRLTLGTLGLAIAILLCKKLPARSTKAIVLLVSIPVLMVMARTRVEFTASLNPDQSASVTGFESVVGPLTWSGELLDRRAEIPLGWGSTFWASAVSMVPRQLWQEKPVGFGAVLVPILTPELVGTIQSDLALSQAEWLYNFGIAGLVLMIPVLGFYVRKVDTWLAAASARSINTRPQLLSLVAATIVAAGLADLFWGGTFTYASRATPRLIIVGLLLLVSRLGMTQGRSFAASMYRESSLPQDLRAR